MSNKNKIGILLYRVIENINGEKKFNIINYKLSQKIKVLILIYLIGV